MTFRRVGGFAAVAVAILLWLACGQVYRPVVIPCVGQVPGCPVETPPTPSNFHAVFALGNNAPNYEAIALKIVDLIDSSGVCLEVGVIALKTAQLILDARERDAWDSLTLNQVSGISQEQQHASQV